MNHEGNMLAVTLAEHGTLTYSYADGHVSWYLNTEGWEIPLGTGGRVLVDLHEIDVHDLWHDWNRTHTSHQNREFSLLIESMLIDPDEWEENWTFCQRCADPEPDDDMFTTVDGRTCDDCVTNNYATCYRCDDLVRDYRWLDEETWCQSCTDDNWTYCDQCECYVRDDSGHSHNGDGCCEAPAQQFSVRNNGHGLLSNDAMTKVSIPAGMISEEGLWEIGTLLRTASVKRLQEANEASGNSATNLSNPAWVEHCNWHSLSYRLEEIGQEWQGKRGNFTKRLSRFFHTNHQITLPPHVISEVGNIARAHSGGSELMVSVTRDLNRPREEFAHSGSCWWSEYGESRCALKTNGGFGLRSWDESDDIIPSGRAWVMPLRLTAEGGLTPTFETEEPDAFMVFNGYGVLSEYAAARIVAHMAGMTYRKIGFEVDAMYINNESGYLVAPESIAEGYTDGCLDLDLARHSSLFDREQESKRAAAAAEAAASSVTETCNHFEPCSHNEMESTHA